MKTLHYGYVLPFIRDPPLLTPSVELSAYKAGTEWHIMLRLAVAEMVEKLDGWAGFFVPKVTWGWMLSFDLLVLHNFLAVTAILAYFPNLPMSLSTMLL